LQPHKANPSKHSMVLQSVFNCHTFCVGCSQPIQHIAILIPLKLHCGSKELCQSSTPNKKTFHSNHHHRSIYASIKTAWSYLNIMLPYSTFSPRL
jgi:hypothetical protein